MEHVIGIPREQITLFPEAIEDYISEDNSVRFLDVFVDKLDTKELGFTHSELKDTGRPPYEPRDILKLHLYGYLNRIRSSRMLERESKRNLEVMWLIKHITFDHKTISEFRRNNKKAIKGVFKEFFLICKQLGLYGAELAAIDSSKFKAVNARDRILDKEQIEKKIQKIEASIEEYINESEVNDAVESNDKILTKEELEVKIDYLKKRKEELKQAKKEIEESQDKYISLTDRDCRLIKDKNGIEPSYRMQTSVDSKNKMIIDFKMTSDPVDNNHLLEMTLKAKEALEVEEITVVADGGYFDSKELKGCQENNIITYVPIPKQKVSSKTNVPEEEYHYDKFSYDKNTGTYTCPEGEKLIYKRTVEKHEKKYLIYSTDKCKSCKNKNKCSLSPRGREIHRWEDAVVIDKLKERLDNDPAIIKKRKAILVSLWLNRTCIWNNKKSLELLWAATSGFAEHYN